MESQLSVEIDRPIKEVFHYTNENVAEWSITCVRDEVIDEKPGHVGTTFRVVTADRGREMEFEGIVTRWEPPRVSAVELTGSQFDLDVRYEFEDLSGRTRVTQHTKVKGKGFVRVMFALFGWAFKKSNCKAQEKELASLKSHCEARHAA